MTDIHRDSRASARVLSSFLGRIELFNKQASYNCAIKDISGTGARVSIDNALLIPNEFILEIPSKGFKKRATVKWREDAEIGVSFEAFDENAILDRLAVVEDELRLLKEQMKSLLAVKHPRS